MKTSTEATENISEEPVSGKRKRGEKREDGRTFFRYRADGREVWLTDCENQSKNAKLPEDFIDRYEALCKIAAQRA